MQKRKQTKKSLQDEERLKKMGYTFQQLGMKLLQLLDGWSSGKKVNKALKIKNGEYHIEQLKYNEPVICAVPGFKNVKLESVLGFRIIHAKTNKIVFSGSQLLWYNLIHNKKCKIKGDKQISAVKLAKIIM